MFLLDEVDVIRNYYLGVWPLLQAFSKGGVRDKLSKSVVVCAGTF